MHLNEYFLADAAAKILTLRVPIDPHEYRELESHYLRQMPEEDSAFRGSRPAKAFQQDAAVVVF
jgi:hypothetical protein